MSIPTGTLDAQFIEVLEALRPRPEFLRLFSAVVTDVWKARAVEVRKLQTSAAARLTQLEQRETLVDNAFLYEERIDTTTYERQRDKLREDIALMHLELEDTRLEELDVQGVMAFAERVLQNAARLWAEVPADQKQLFQRAIFPEGLRLKDGRFGTAVTSLAFSQLTEVASKEYGVASSICASWNQLGRWLRAVDGLRRAA